ncbi:MAG: hypothetical protein CVU56_06155 [Deltaproteobacteria bacterium HGW-Deltaproteobacteria-14]|nr:MAG: hypothetical protein CVU56_06155 [Deltaproteobacteria bacterium HGW-Deltaproteobacteria-14]
MIGRPMIALELACVAIVALYLVVRVRRDPEPRAFLLRLLVLAVGAWIGEDACIRAYHFYAYSPRWSLFLDQVPLLIIAIWPVVIHSAWDLARRLTRDPRHVPLVGALIVLADASLIEPIAVQSGLWWWTEPGLFAVPPIGILGWAFYAGLAMLVFGQRRRSVAWVFPIASGGVHLLLLATWWGALRWVNGTIDPWPVVGLAWALSLTLAALSWRRGAGARVPRVELLLRVPAAGFFFVLLALHGADAWALVAYALAFAPPYLVMTAQSWRAPTQVTSG